MGFRKLLPKVGGSAGSSSCWGKIGHSRWSAGRNTTCVASFLYEDNLCLHVLFTRLLRHSNIQASEATDDLSVC